MQRCGDIVRRRRNRALETRCKCNNVELWRFEGFATDVATWRHVGLEAHYGRNDI